MVCDLTSRGDSQNHADYAARLFGWDLSTIPSTSVAGFRPRAWDFDRSIGDYFHPFDRAGRRVTCAATSSPSNGTSGNPTSPGSSDAPSAISTGTSSEDARRVVFDGLEPAERFSESIQFEFFEYIYHQVLRKEDEWAAQRVLPRELSRASRPQVLPSLRPSDDRLPLSLHDAACHPRRADGPADQQGDIFPNANTIILMGRTRQNGTARPSARRHQAPRQRLRRDEILPYRITEEGLVSMIDP